MPIRQRVQERINRLEGADSVPFQGSSFLISAPFQGPVSLLCEPGTLPVRDGRACLILGTFEPRNYRVFPRLVGPFFDFALLRPRPDDFARLERLAE